MRSTLRSVLLCASLCTISATKRKRERSHESLDSSPPPAKSARVEPPNAGPMFFLELQAHREMLSEHLPKVEWRLSGTTTGSSTGLEYGGDWEQIELYWCKLMELVGKSIQDPRAEQSDLSRIQRFWQSEEKYTFGQDGTSVWTDNNKLLIDYVQISLQASPTHLEFIIDTFGDDSELEGTGSYTLETVEGQRGSQTATSHCSRIILSTAREDFTASLKSRATACNWDFKQMTLRRRDDEILQNSIEAGHTTIASLVVVETHPHELVNQNGDGVSYSITTTPYSSWFGRHIGRRFDGAVEWFRLFTEWREQP